MWLLTWKWVRAIWAYKNELGQSAQNPYYLAH